LSSIIAKSAWYSAGVLTDQPVHEDQRPAQRVAPQLIGHYALQSVQLLAPYLYQFARSCRLDHRDSGAPPDGRCTGSCDFELPTVATTDAGKHARRDRDLGG
jgi:hypothetical protein